MKITIQVIVHELSLLKNFTQSPFSRIRLLDSTYKRVYKKNLLNDNSLNSEYL